MGLRQVFARIIEGNPRCAYCNKDGPWNVGGQQVCDTHKRELRAMGFTSQPRRC